MAPVSQRFFCSFAGNEIFDQSKERVSFFSDSILRTEWKERLPEHKSPRALISGEHHLPIARDMEIALCYGDLDGYVNMGCKKSLGRTLSILIGTSMEIFSM